MRKVKLLMRQAVVLQPDQRIIVVSAAFEIERVVAAIRAGALGCVKKGARPEELLISIERAFVGQPSIDPAVLMKVLKNIHPDEKYKLFPTTDVDPWKNAPLP